MSIRGCSCNLHRDLILQCKFRGQFLAPDFRPEAKWNIPVFISTIYFIVYVVVVVFFSLFFGGGGGGWGGGGGGGC